MKNYVQFFIKGLNQEKFFNNLSCKVNVFDIVRTSKSESSFKVAYFEKNKAEKILKENGFEILKVKKRGILHVLMQVLLSWGLIFGIIVGMGFYFFQNAFIQKIEVWGNEKISDSSVVTFVKTKIGSGIKTNINTKKLENYIFSEFKNLSFVSVAVVGQTLIINLKEEFLPEEISAEFSPIISNFDGIVREINLIQGTLNVAVGDIIEAGQVLVEPFVFSGEQKLKVKPMAEITLDVWVEGKEEHLSSYKKTYKTGRKIKKSEVYLCGLKIYEKPAENVFNTYEVEENEQILTKNNILPFKLKTTIFYETKTEEINQNFDEVKDEIIEKARQKALQNLDDCDIIINEDVSVLTVGVKTEVRVLLTLRKIIGAK